MDEMEDEMIILPTEEQKEEWRRDFAEKMKWANSLTEEQKADYQREYRRDGRTIRKLQKQRIDLLEKDNEILRELYRQKVLELEQLRRSKLG